MLNNKVLIKILVLSWLKEKRGGMLVMWKRKEIFQKPSYCLQDVATEVQRPEQVALGPAVIIFFHKPQRRHKGLEAVDIQIKQPLALNHMRSNLHSPIQTWAVAEYMIWELRETGLRGEPTWNETSNMWRIKSKHSHRCHKGHCYTMDMMSNESYEQLLL